MQFTTEITHNMDSFVKVSKARIARASTLAIKDTAAEVKTGARAAIAAGGFSARWQNAFQVNVYPKAGYSAEAAMFGYSKIDYANIFQTGGTIRGVHGLLWVPLPSAPKRAGGKKMTVSRYIQTIGPLIYLKRAGHPPVLVAKVLRAVRGGKQVATATLKRGLAAAKAGKKTKIVPIFVGLTSVTLRRRFNVTPVYDAAAAKVGSRFDQYMGEE